MPDADTAMSSMLPVKVATRGSAGLQPGLRNCRVVCGSRSTGAPPLPVGATYGTDWASRRVVQPVAV
jgi:hypothetical protein